MIRSHSSARLVLFTLACMLPACSASSEGDVPDDPGSESPLGSTATGTVWSTQGARLNVRAEPNTTSAIVTTLAAGKKVTISCQVSGQSVNGTAVWNFLPAHGGYVSDAFLYTGHDGFIPGVPKCAGSAGSGCGSLDYTGECDGTLLSWCEDGKKHEVDCADSGRSCAYQDASIGYNCVSGSGGSGGAGGSGGGSVGPLYVRGVKLDASQEKWVRHIGEQIVPEMLGSRSERLKKAAYVTWWSLKEGVLNLDNPLAYSNCHFPPDQHIGPLDVCPNANNAWQVGISGVQAAWRSLSDVEALAAQVHPEKSTTQVLVDAAQAAGFGPSSGTGQSVASSSGRLRLSWLLRDGATGFEAQYPTVHGECFVTCSGGWENTCSWCFGSGWDTSAAFAPSKSSSQQSVSDLNGILDELAP